MWKKEPLNNPIHDANTFDFDISARTQIGTHMTSMH